MRRWLAILLIVLVMGITLILLLIASLDIVFSDLGDKNTQYLDSSDFGGLAPEYGDKPDYLDPGRSDLYFGPPLD